MTGRQSALVRAVNAMIRAMGGASMKLRIAAASTGSGRELGVEAPLVQELQISPVIVRSLSRSGNERTVEVVISSSVLEGILLAYGSTDGAAFLRSAEQVLYGEDVFAITDVKVERFAGVEYLYRIRAASVG
jgi:hypothetical protein